MLRKLRRVMAMSAEERRARLRAKWSRWGPAGMALRVSWTLERLARRKFNVPYGGRPDVGPRNFTVKMERLAAGGTFEQAGIQLVNLAAVGLLPEESRVFEIGGGTGYFASAAARLRRANVVCSEYDTAAREWAERNRPHPSVVYCKRALEGVEAGEFDVVVALEVVEHINSYGALLRRMARAAPMAILSTPNKLRNAFAAVQAVPEYDEHVLEWTAGEFYWVLRAFWQDVQLWTLPRYQRQTDAFRSGRIEIPVVASAGLWEVEEPLVAVCRSAIVME